MSLESRKRVFILGAGVSVWAGFPLGRDLWPFLLNHVGFDSPGLEFIAAHLASFPASKRQDVESDLELLLTRLSQRNVGGEVATKREGSKEEKEYLRHRCRHLIASGRYDFEVYYDTQVRRRASGIVGWTPSFEPEFIKSLIVAFSHHHSCISSGRGCYAPGVEGYPRCACFPARSFNQQRWRLRRAVKRAFVPGDTIITFNWDCVLESILWDAGLWSLSDGYGFHVAIDPSLVRHWSIPSLATRPSGIEILKAHGSINWVTSPEHHRIGLNFLDLLFGLPVGTSYLGDGWDEDIPEWPYVTDALLAPTYLKDYSENRVLGGVWDRIIESVAGAQDITVIGYSLPKSDLSSRALLAFALRQNKRCRNLSLVGRRQTGWDEFLRNLERKGVVVAGSFEQWLSALGTPSSVRSARKSMKATRRTA